MKWLPTKLCGFALIAVRDLPRGYWRLTPRKQARTLTENLYHFHIQFSDNPLFYERSYYLFARGKAGRRAEFIETSDTGDQRTRLQCDLLSRSVDTSLMDEFGHHGKSLEGFGIGSSCGLSRIGSLSKVLLGQEENTRIAEGGRRKKITGYGDEVQTGAEVEFTEEVCGQIKQKNYRAALSKYENSDIREILTEEKFIERSDESCGPDEHHATEKDYILSPESEELSDEQSDDDYLFAYISDTEFFLM